MEQHNTDHAFSEQDWTEMEDARPCTGCDDGCDQCDPLPEYTAADEHRDDVNFLLRVMARQLGVNYLAPSLAAAMWECVPNLERIATSGDLDTFDALMREHTRFDGAWTDYQWVPPSILQVRAARARREGGAR